MGSVDEVADLRESGVARQAQPLLNWRCQARLAAYEARSRRAITDYENFAPLLTPLKSVSKIPLKSRAGKKGPNHSPMAPGLVYPGGVHQAHTEAIAEAAGVGWASASRASAPPECVICLGSDPPPIQSGCACRSDTGLAHVSCLIENALIQQAHRGYDVWSKCQTCEHRFTRAMLTELAVAWWSRVCDQTEESAERLSSAHNLASVRRSDGQYADAERINREVLGVHRRVLGEEHPSTLTSASNLAGSLSDQGKYVEAERISREVLGVERRVLGEEHPSTLTSANNLAAALSGRGKHAQAERICREVLGVQRRVLGEEHPDTLISAANLASSLSRQGKYVEAEEMLEVALCHGRRVLGSTHPTTLLTAEFLEIVRSNKQTKQPANGRGKTVPVARRTERAAPAVAPLSPTAMAEVEVKAGAAEAELLAMLELEEAAAGSGTVRSAPKGKAKGNKGKRG